MLKTDRVNMNVQGSSGSSLQETIDVAYAVLVDLFGEPNRETDGYKVDAEWQLEFDGEYLTIYNYKTGKNYLGAEGDAVEFITDWHIGGNDKEKATEFVQFIKDEMNEELNEVPEFDDADLPELFERITNLSNSGKFCISEFIADLE